VLREDQWTGERKRDVESGKCFLIALQDRFHNAMHKRLASTRISSQDFWKELRLRREMS
jgi:hypothetical protein